MRILNADKLIEVIRNGDFPKKGELHRIIDQLSFEAPIGEIPQLKSEDKQQIDYTNVYYTDPTQVIFHDEGGYMCFGIAFHEYVVELSTGRVYTCKQILGWALDRSEELDTAIWELGWNSILIP